MKEGKQGAQRAELRDAKFAGWGARHELKCTTNEYGPVRNSKCKFPFRYKMMLAHECIKMSNPTSLDAMCRMLKKKQNFSVFPPEGVVHIDIEQKGKADDDSLMTRCFNQSVKICPLRPLFLFFLIECRNHVLRLESLVGVGHALKAKKHPVDLVIVEQMPPMERMKRWMWKPSRTGVSVTSIARTRTP